MIYSDGIFTRDRISDHGTFTEVNVLRPSKTTRVLWLVAFLCCYFPNRNSMILYTCYKSNPEKFYWQLSTMNTNEYKYDLFNGTHVDKKYE